jgi:hypothetical protein
MPPQLSPKPPDLDAAGRPVTADPYALSFRAPSLPSVTLPAGRPPDLDAQGQPVASSPAAPPLPEEPSRNWAETVGNVGLGVAKGLGNTVYGLGKMAHDYTPIGRISDAIQPGAFAPAAKPPELTPRNTPQRVGYGAEQIGEFFLPTGTGGAALKAGSKLARLAEVLKAGTLTTAQTGGNLGAAGTSAALTAALPPIAGAVRKLAPALKANAADTAANSLYATTRPLKTEAAKLGPEMLRRRVGGSIRALREQAAAMAAKEGARLNTAYQAAAAAGETVPLSVVRQTIKGASDGLHALAANGKPIPVPGYETTIQKLAHLDDFVSQLPPDLPVDRAAGIKRMFDDIVYPKLASESERSQEWVLSKASDSLRKLINTNPTLEKLNAETSFWIGLRTVADATKLRRVGQSGGLLPRIAQGAGAGAGAYLGGGLSGAIVGGYAANQLQRLLSSPAYMNKVSAPLKSALADALASGSAARVNYAVQKVVASLPSSLRQEFAH